MLDLTEHLHGGRTERGLEQPTVGDALAQGIGDGARLLVDLLEHEVRVLALVGGVGRELALVRLAYDGGTRPVDDAHGGATDLGDIAFLEEHEMARDGQQRRDVRGDEVLRVAEADDDGATFAGEDDALGIVLAHHRQRVGALELGDRGTHRLEEVGARLHVLVDAVGDHLGVGLGGELVARRLQLGAQDVVVLDDAVVDDGETVRGDVRVRVALRGHAVRRPSGVGDAEVGGGRRGVDGFLQALHLADGAQALELAGAVDHGDAGGVVAAVLEAPQALHEDGDDVTLRDGADDAAHGG